MIIQDLYLQSFRCFAEKHIDVAAPLVVFQGANGCGKSSLLEALHYCCYLRSFRSASVRDLISVGAQHFFVRAHFLSGQESLRNNISVGYSVQEGKVVRFNQKSIVSYRDLIDSFKVVTLYSEDLQLIGGAPELRRNFLNYALMLSNTVLLETFKQYKIIQDQRNALLQKATSDAVTASEEFLVWSKALWEETLVVRRERVALLKQLENEVNRLLCSYFVLDGQMPEQVTLEYSAKNSDHVGDVSFEVFWAGFSCKDQERQFRRSCFGAHLDDFTCVFRNQKARFFASRGQQKLLALLLKIAQLKILVDQGRDVVILLDDFITDFDSTYVSCSLKMLSELGVQVFLTSPIHLEHLFVGIDKVLFVYL